MYQAQLEPMQKPAKQLKGSNGERNDTAFALRSGSQHVFVSDANGTKKTLSFEIPQIAPLSLTLSADTFANGKHLSCFTCKDGAINSSVSGGRAPYTYSWIPGGQNTENLSDLSTGLYVLQVTDAIGGTTTAWIHLTSPERPDWTMEGNSGTDPETQFIGTTDQTDVVFKTNNEEVLRLGSDGSLGVGVESPL